MNEILYNRIKSIPLKKNEDYKSQLNRIFEHYRELSNEVVPRNLKYEITDEYSDTVIVQLTDKNGKDIIKL